MHTGSIHLILGASGYLGLNLLHHARERREGPGLLAVSRDPERGRLLAGGGPEVWIPYAGWEGKAEALLDQGRGLRVLNAIALADHAACEADPAAAARANRDTALRAARWCHERRVPFVSIGTDGLFGNAERARAPRYWSPEDPARPLNVYARTKREAELDLAELGWGQVLRLSFVGPDRGTGRGLLAFLARCLADPRREVPGYTDLWFSPLPTQILAPWLLDFLDQAPGGHAIRHWGCHPALTKHDYLEAVARAAGFEPRMIPLRRAPARPEELEALKVPLDQSLSCERACTLEELIRWGAQALRESFR